MALDVPIRKGFWFVNTGTVVPSGAKHRRWTACREYNFTSAGQGKQFRDEILKLEVDDIICAYESGTGYLGIGIVEEKGVMASKFKYNGKTLHGMPFIAHTDAIYKKGLFTNETDPINADYLVRVNWYPVNTKPLRIPRNTSAYYAPLNTVAQLNKQPTIDKIKEHFGVDFIR